MARTISTHGWRFWTFTAALLGCVSKSGDDAVASDTESSSEAGEISDIGTAPCPDQLLQLPAGLSFHLLQGECVDGLCSWDYDPVGAQITQIVGSYEQASGAFEWQVGYAPSHWRTSTHVVGTAELTSGHELSSSTVTTLDVLGVETVETVELQLVGCNMVRTTTNAINQVFVLEGEFGATFIYTEGQIPEMWTSPAFVAEASGTRLPTGLVDEAIEIDGPADLTDEPSWWNYVHTLSGDADGNTDIEFWQFNLESDWDRSGTCSWDLTGTRSCLVDVDSEDSGATVEWSVDYGGDGSGVWSGAYYDSQLMDWVPIDCPITISDGVCSVLCPNGATPDCRYFLME